MLFKDKGRDRTSSYFMDNFFHQNGALFCELTALELIRCSLYMLIGHSTVRDGTWTKGKYTCFNKCKI